MYLKDALGKEGVQELISNLSKDTGKFLLPSLALSLSQFVMFYDIYNSFIKHIKGYILLF
jgi:hypothetical protein